MNLWVVGIVLLILLIVIWILAKFITAFADANKALATAKETI